MQLTSQFDFTKHLTAAEMAQFEAKCEQRGEKPDATVCKLIKRFVRAEAKKSQPAKKPA